MKRARKKVTRIKIKPLAEIKATLGERNFHKGESLFFNLASMTIFCGKILSVQPNTYLTSARNNFLHAGRKTGGWAWLWHPDWFDFVGEDAKIVQRITNRLIKEMGK